MNKNIVSSHQQIGIVNLDKNDFYSDGEYRIKYLKFFGGEPFASISFQDGPIKENGVNGCAIEDLLEIVLHRLIRLQGGDYNCPENAAAIVNIQKAVGHLNARTCRD
jgi:hypothetical protein